METHRRVKRCSALKEEIQKLKENIKSVSIDYIQGAVNLINNEHCTVNSEGTEELVVQTEVLRAAVDLYNEVVPQIKVVSVLSLPTFISALGSRVSDIGWSEAMKTCKLILPALSVQGLAHNTESGLVSKEEGAKQRQRHGKVVFSEPTRCLEVTGENSEKRENVNELLNIVLTALKEEFKKQNRVPIDYWSFVLDTSFSQTVNNIFSVSLLVKENLCRINIYSTNEIKIEPLSQEKQQLAKSSVKHQAVINLNPVQHKEMIKTRMIVKGVISHHMKC